MRVLIISVISLLIFVISALSCCTRIDAGHEGILVNQFGSEKGVSNVSLVTGTVWYLPWKYDVHEFPTFVQTVDYPEFTVNAKDGSVFRVDPTLSISVLPGRSPQIFQKYRKDLEEIIGTTLYNYTRDAFRIQFNNYTTDSMISRRAAFENAVQVYLEKELAKEGFHLEQMTSGLQYPQTITNAIEAKNKAVQDAFRIDNEVKSTEATARKKVAEAEGSAKAKKIEADADAYVYQAKQRALTPLIIQQQWIDKWDGKLPVYGNAPTMFKAVE